MTTDKIKYIIGSDLFNLICSIDSIEKLKAWQSECISEINRVKQPSEISADRSHKLNAELNLLNHLINITH